jgi:hypothetical protein
MYLLPFCDPSWAEKICRGRSMGYGYSDFIAKFKIRHLILIYFEP